MVKASVCQECERTPRRNLLICPLQYGLIVLESDTGTLIVPEPFAPLSASDCPKSETPPPDNTDSTTHSYRRPASAMNGQRRIRLSAAADSRSALRKCGDFQANNEFILDQLGHYSLDDSGTATNGSTSLLRRQYRPNGFRDSLQMTHVFSVYPLAQLVHQLTIQQESVHGRCW